MVHSLERVTIRRGREIFVFLAAFTSAMALDLLLRGDWQALLFAAVALTCIRPIRERPPSAGPKGAAVYGVLGLAFWLALRLGIPAILRRIA